MTNLFKLPCLDLEVTTFTNVDWLDALSLTDDTCQICAGATIAAPGQGYSQGTQTLAVVGGIGAPTQVNAVVIGSAVAALAGFVTRGAYQVTPPPANAAVVGGGGTGCLLNLIFRGAPIDLTGISFRSQIKTSAGSSGVLLNMSTDNGLMISGGRSGALAYAVPAYRMARVSPGSYVSDIIASDASGRSVLVASIALTHFQGVTP